MKEVEEWDEKGGKNCGGFAQKNGNKNGKEVAGDPQSSKGKGPGLGDLLGGAAAPSPPPPPPTAANITTCLYTTELGLAALTWCRQFWGRSLLVELKFAHPFDQFDPFHLHMKPLLFWRKQGSKRFGPKNRVEICWDFSKSKFGSSSDPQSGFYVCVIVDGEMTLLVGDAVDEAFARTRARKPKQRTQNQVLVLRREHVFGHKSYTTRARFGGKLRNISIDCTVGDESKLCFSVDRKRVLHIKQLKWKFRGNERVEIDGVPVQISWDVFNWLFDEDVVNRHAVFMFRFERTESDEKELNLNNKMVLWDQSQQRQQKGPKQGMLSGYLGMNSLEMKKLKKSSFKTRSSSSSSISSASSSACSSSVMEWTSREESELQSQSGFSLLVYAWRN
ncbi:hypothetical protein Scep_023809 [Stephania cephalantha]|uniref:DUF868 domain-containing protein n=1 Tax=Stephania cephalantha TaxID=152367 RepID=A0AAP0HXS3_9MAGN